MVSDALRRLVLSDDEGEFQARIPRNEKEAKLLRAYVAAARRFLAAAEGALRVYEGRGGSVLRLPGGER